MKFPRVVREGGCIRRGIDDVNSTIFHVNEKGEISVFDFEQCGYDYKAFDVGKYLSSIHPLPQKPELNAFIGACQDIRRQSEAVLGAIPYFEIVARI
jgi:Ser/Thr protein kinase RdoA (MazF antagonist)